MTRSRFFRHLRIAVSAGFGILCLLLIALWARSYWVWDLLEGEIPLGPKFLATSSEGSIYASIGYAPSALAWHRDSAPMWFINAFNQESIPLESWRLSIVQNCLKVVVPHWFPILLTASITTLFWVPRRFSLHTLLIVTTLVAVVLGLVVLL